MTSEIEHYLTMIQMLHGVIEDQKKGIEQVEKLKDMILEGLTLEQRARLLDLAEELIMNRQANKKKLEDVQRSILSNPDYDETLN